MDPKTVLLDDEMVSCYDEKAMEEDGRRVDLVDVVCLRIFRESENYGSDVWVQPPLLRFRRSCRRRVRMRALKEAG